MAHCTQARLARNVVVKQLKNGLGPIELSTILVEYGLVLVALRMLDARMVLFELDGSLPDVQLDSACCR